MLRKCDKCICPCLLILNNSKKLVLLLIHWILNNPFKTTPILVAILFFGLMCCVTYLQPSISAFAVLVTSFGSIFAAIKYKLDEASYNKDLFEERYEVFSVIEEVLWDYFHMDKTVYLSLSGAVGAYLGLTPQQYASGEINRHGSISKMGPATCRSALYEAVFVLLVRCKRNCKLKTWGLKLMKKKGLKKAVVAVARKLAIIMHRMLIDKKEFSYV